MGTFDILNILLGPKNRWLAGAVMAVLAVFLQTLGIILVKKAQYLLMGEKVRRGDPTPAVTTWMCHELFLLGCLLFIIHTLLVTFSLAYTLETTIVPLMGIECLFNTALSYGVLYERFTHWDITATVVVILCGFATSASIDQEVPSHLNDMDVSAVQSVTKIWENQSFAVYVVVMLFTFLACLYVLVGLRAMRTTIRPFALPLLVGICSSVFHFSSKISWTLMMSFKHSGGSLADLPNSHMQSCAITALSYMAGFAATIECVRELPCRFAIPAMVLVSQVLLVTQNIVFFKEWQNMNRNDTVILYVASLIGVIALGFIDTERRLVVSPKFSPLLSPRLDKGADQIYDHRSIVQIIDEYKVRQPNALRPRPLETINMQVPFHARHRFFPFFACAFTVTFPVILWAKDWQYCTLLFLTCFSCYQGWKMGAFIALFAYVGIKKVQHFDSADFRALWKAEQKKKVDDRKKLGSNADADAPGPKWKDVTHFVLLPNYKESEEDLEMSIGSVASSKEAKESIGLVLAMEEREEGCREKATRLIDKYKGQFKYCEATFHPFGIKNEIPGKSANTKWAAAEVLGKFIPQHGLDINNVVLTVGDADSEFHSEYFAAVSYYFLHAGGPEDTTPLRYTTIWQAPIFHMKNYVGQPAVIRLASFIVSEHELAYLADPNACRTPYSTYSVSAVLAKSVDGWDPEWISEDWHMALKCFLATAGRLKITPIFLPILNNTPEADGFVKTILARWVQAKRHALGFCEMTYMQENSLRVLTAIPTKWAQTVYCWRYVFMWVKLLMIHLFMAVFIVNGPLNATMIAYFASHEVEDRINVNSWTFLANAVFQVIGLIAFTLIFALSVVLYETVKTRISGTDSIDLHYTWKSQPLHFVTVVVQSIVFFPCFFAVASAAEWIAAVKTMATHKFEYITAAEGARQV